MVESYPCRTISALFLSVLCILPSPDLALRPTEIQQQRSGLEEMKKKLIWTDQTHSVGLEEGYAEKVIALVALDLNRSFAGKVELGYDYSVAGRNGFHPEWALVQGAGKDWWIHLHLNKGLPDVPYNGLLFRLLLFNGKIMGAEDPMVEPTPLSSLHNPQQLEGFIPLNTLLQRGLIDKEVIPALKKAALELIQQSQEPLEERIQGEKTSFVLGQAISPAGAKGLFQMLSKKDLGESATGRGSFYGRVLYERLGLGIGTGLEELVLRFLSRVQPQAILAAGLEEGRFREQMGESL